MSKWIILTLTLIITLLSTSSLSAIDYNVGPSQPLASIGAVPWESLVAGDRVRIHYKSTPYYEKWVVCGAGTVNSPIIVEGVPNGSGVLPVISGENAVTRLSLDFWSEGRGIIKVGGSSLPADTATYIIIRNLEIKSGRPAYSFTDDAGAGGVYGSNCAAIFIEKGSNIVIENCILRDCGNGLFAASQAAEVMVNACYIYDNGIDSSIFEHNNYTEADGITFQFNYFGPLRTNCPGNNLKDRSTGLVVRYNWIESGNRQLDLVDSSNLNGHADYGETFVYGNILVEHEGDGNSQIIHFGGDSGTTANYRGHLYFYHNTVVSTRTGNTTFIRLSTNSQVCTAYNNILYVSEAASLLAMVDSDGDLNLGANFIKPGWKDTHGTLNGNIYIDHANIEETDPGFDNEAGKNYRIIDTSTCVDKGVSLPAACLPDDKPVYHYIKHRLAQNRSVRGSGPDIGAYEYYEPSDDKDNDNDSGVTIGCMPASRSASQSVLFVLFFAACVMLFMLRVTRHSFAVR
ncbi:polysaccharide-degrading enzyme [Planctomycetota bacterium]